MTFAVGDGRGVTALTFGVSLFSPKWQRSSLTHPFHPYVGEEYEATERYHTCAGYALRSMEHGLRGL